MTIDFAAIDFETANEFRGSPCAIGLALVRNGKIVEEHRLLMRPPQSSGPDDFASFNVDLHGISWEMVKDEPEFLDIWNSLTPIIGDLPLVAHNAAFDIGVLRDALDLRVHSRAIENLSSLIKSPMLRSNSSRLCIDA